MRYSNHIIYYCNNNKSGFDCKLKKGTDLRANIESPGEPTGWTIAARIECYYWQLLIINIDGIVYIIDFVGGVYNLQQPSSGSSSDRVPIALFLGDFVGSNEEEEEEEEDY